MQRETIAYAGRAIPVVYRAECCVVGGGTAGVAAAVSAARGGCWTVLAERGISLGGMQTLGLVQPFMQQCGVPLAWFGPIWAGANLTVALCAYHSHKVLDAIGLRRRPGHLFELGDR